MAVGHCSNVQEGGWHFAVQKKCVDRQTVGITVILLPCTDHTQSALQSSQKLITMAVKCCSKAGAAGWHNALQKK